MAWRKRRPSVSRRQWLSGLISFGGWWIRTTRKRPSERASSSSLRSRSVWPASDAAGRHERRGRDGRRDADQRDMILPAHERKQRLVDELGVVREHPRRPKLAVAMMGARHVGIVISRDRRHLVGRPELLQPAARVLELLAPSDVGEVAGDRDVVGLLRLEIGDQPVERPAGQKVQAVSPPVDVADGPLRDEVPAAERRDVSKMHVGEMA